MSHFYPETYSLTARFTKIKSEDGYFSSRSSQVCHPRKKSRQEIKARRLQRASAWPFHRRRTDDARLWHILNQQTELMELGA